MSALDIDHLRDWIGREEITSELVTQPLVERFNATFDRVEEVGDGTSAPALIHFCLAPQAARSSELEDDGHPARGSFLPPVPLPRRMWAGGALTFHGDIRVGEQVTRHSTIRDVVVKEGRTGTLCFVTVDHRIKSGDRHVIDERQDIVYRGADASGGVHAPREPAPHGTHHITVTPTTAMLFRYSALTFNSHRIHYDRPYARDVENYRGLIVHGPMQATMLLQFAEKLKGQRPTQFDFRSLSPVFDDEDFTLNATEQGVGLKLWTSAVNGGVAMEAQATW